MQKTILHINEQAIILCCIGKLLLYSLSPKTQAIHTGMIWYRYKNRYVIVFCRNRHQRDYVLIEETCAALP